MLARIVSLTIGLTIALPAAAQATNGAPASSASVTTMRAAEDGAAVTALAELASDDVVVRRAAAAKLATLPNPKESLPLIAGALDAARKKASGSVVASAIKAARQSSSTDVATALVETRTDGPGYAAALTTAVLLKPLASIGTTPAVRELVRVAGDYGGAFRPELAQTVKTLGDKAVPALLETRIESASVRTWAFAQLEAMGKRVPADAVQTQDNQVLVDVLLAFAKVHDVDALPVVLSFVNSDRVPIRTAARGAVLQFGPDAIYKLREAYSNVTGHPAAEGLNAGQIANDLFAAYDRLRLQEVYALIDEGLAKQKEGKYEEAIAAFDKVLARQPLIERRNEMVPAYFEYALSLEDKDREQAIALFKKAKRLWPDGPRVNPIDAELAYLDGVELRRRGIDDIEPFRRALELEPTHQKAREEILRWEMLRKEREGRVHVAAAVSVSLFIASIGFILFGGRRRPRRLRV